ncbi:restriction endonuclease subunit S [Thioalkalivibrio sp. HK1]|uniref:restriction endonuclease subunit S n=1 Tax=Thioalkalivibrio sp. HK1 TaxID=1469245 RepID=UPI00046FD451|nr:restriction endonuclease subunit S [Thioalkalivibrio sp. HK1]
MKNPESRPLPDGWQEVKLIDACKVITPRNRIQKAKYLSQGRFPIVSQEAPFISGYSDEKGNVLDSDTPVTVFGDHTCCVKYVDFPFCVGGEGVKILKPRHVLHDKFFYYLIENKRISIRGYRRHFSLLKNAILSYPDIAQQKRIVEFVEIWNKSIETIGNLIDEKKRKFEYLLSDLIRFDSKPKIPLGEMCPIARGNKTPPPKEKRKYLEINDINIKSKRYNLDRKKKSPIEGSIYVPAGTMLVSTVRPTRGAITITREDLYVSSAFCRVRIDNNYPFYCLQHKKFKVHMRQSQTGGAYPSVNHSDILNFEIPVKSLPEQEYIGRVLDVASREIYILDMISMLYRKEKQGIIQKFLSGQWPISQLPPEWPRPSEESPEDTTCDQKPCEGGFDSEGIGIDHHPSQATVLK